MKNPHTKIALAASLALFMDLPALAQRGYPPEIEGAEERVYKEASGAALKLWVFSPDEGRFSGPRPAILFFFGGGWRSGSPSQFVPQSQHLASKGMVAIVVDYRVASRHQTLAKDCVEDARDAMRYVRTHAEQLGIDPNRVAAGGGSAGGHIAACLGTLKGNPDSKPNALALFNPACVLAPVEGMESPDPERFAGLEARMGVDPVELSPYHHVTSDAPPCVIFHGTADTTVPYLTAELFTDKMKEAGVTCVLHGFEGAGHGFFNARNRSADGEGSAYDTIQGLLDQFLAELGWMEG